MELRFWGERGVSPKLQSFNWLQEDWKRIPLPMQETQEMWVPSLAREDPLEKEMATYSSIHAWKIPWAEEPGGLHSMGSQSVRHNWATEHTQGNFNLRYLIFQFIYFIFSLLDRIVLKLSSLTDLYLQIYICSYLLKWLVLIFEDTEGMLGILEN